MIHIRLKKLFDLLARRRAILPQTLLGKAVRYALNQWPNLEVYLGHGRVEVDTNLVENAIRPTKLGAKNWLFVGREAAGEKTAILDTIVENCRRLAIAAKRHVIRFRRCLDNGALAASHTFLRDHAAASRKSAIPNDTLDGGIARAGDG
jgi:hypothetical protein